MENGSHTVMSDSLWPHGPKPARFLCPWDSPGKNTGVGCLSLLQKPQGRVYCVCAGSVTHSCPTPCDPMGGYDPLSTEFSWQEHWSGFPSPLWGDLPDPGLNWCLLHFLHWKGDSLTQASFEKARVYYYSHFTKEPLTIWKAYSKWQTVDKVMESTMTPLTFSFVWKLPSDRSYTYLLVTQATCRCP